MTLLCAGALATLVQASTVSSVTVTLNPGWNGVGLQAAQLSQLSNNPAIAGIASFNGASYQTGSFTTADFNAGAGGRRGFWVFANSATSFTYSGSGGPDSLDLVQGYNLVSFTTSADIPGSALTATVGGVQQPLGNVVLTQFSEIRPDNTYALVDVAAGGTLKPGAAYWIFASTAARLNVSTAPGTGVTLTNATVPAGTTSAQVQLVAGGVGTVLATVPATISASNLTFTVPTGLTGFNRARAVYFAANGGVLGNAAATLSPGQTTAQLGTTNGSNLITVGVSAGSAGTSLKVGQTVQLTTTGTYLSGGATFGPLTVTGATFSSSNGAAASVSATGAVTGLASGSTTVTATLPNPQGGTTSGDIQFTVTP